MTIDRIWQVSLLNAHGYVPANATEAQAVCDGIGYMCDQDAADQDIPLPAGAKVTIVEPVDEAMGVWHVTLPKVVEDRLEEFGWVCLIGHTGSVEGETP